MAGTLIFCLPFFEILLAYVLVCEGKAHLRVHGGKRVRVVVVAVVLGVLAGLASSFPFVAGLRRVRRTLVSDDAAGRMGYTGILLAVVALSALVLFGTMIACALLARDVLVPFAAAEVVVFLASTIACAVACSVRK